jgi:hypothetical protein
MNKKYQINVFGKAGCDKCHTLNQRLDKILLKEDFKAFGKHYYDVETTEGLVAFSEAQCINPSRIPAMLLTAWNEQEGEYLPIENSSPGEPDPLCKKARLYQFLGLQTDYSETGKGLITPQMIQSLLARV